MQRITESILRSYKEFAKYYQLLISGRDHAIKQANLLDWFIQNLSAGSRILDAACGAGDVLEILATRYPHRLAGADGSAAMLTYALERPQLQGVPLSHSYFTALNRLGSHQDRFDLIYFLGNAIAHLTDKEEIIECLTQTWNILAPKGTVIFDFRDWTYSDELSHLIEPGRPIEQEKQIQLGHDLKKDSAAIQMSELCFYADGRQFIEYRVRNKGESVIQDSEVITFSYLPFTSSEALEMLIEAGFHQCGIAEPRTEYKYLVAFGQKTIATEN